MARVLGLLSILVIATLIAATFPFSKSAPQLGERSDGPANPSGAGGLEPRNEALPGTGRLEPGRWPPTGYGEVEKYRQEIDPATGQPHLVPVPSGK